MKLFTYFRSSAAYRVRIALHLKGVAFESARIDLRHGGQSSPEYLMANPSALVPALEVDGRVLAQSLAIIEYLDEVHPAPPLLPASALDRAFVRGIAQSIACDLHPLNNLRVLNHLKRSLAQDEAARDRWYAHWIEVGFTALEAALSREPRVGRHCFGDAPTLADVCLVPQMANAERMNCDIAPYPTLRRLVANARQIPAFQAAAPEVQPDAV